MKSKIFKIYELLNPTNNNIFYVGKATCVKGQTARWLQHIWEAKTWDKTSTRGNRLKIETILDILNENLLPIVNIVFETTNEQEALMYEMKLINRYGLIRDKTGILTNILRESYKPSGKQHSESTKQLISNTRKERISSGEIIPTKHTEEHRTKLKLFNPGGLAKSKEIYQIDSITGVVLYTWPAAQRAETTLSITNVAVCATRYKNQTAGGFYWRWVGDTSIVQNKLQQINELNNIRLNNSKRASKRIIQLDNQQEIRVWNSASDAARGLNVSIAAISKAAKNNTISAGYNWKYE